MDRNGNSRSGANGARIAAGGTTGAAGRDGAAGDQGIVIDCDACVLRDLACGDCARTRISGNGPRGAPRDIRREPRVVLDAEQWADLQEFIAAGLFPPLRYRLPLAKAS